MWKFTSPALPTTPTPQRSFGAPLFQIRRTSDPIGLPITKLEPAPSAQTQTVTSQTPTTATIPTPQRPALITADSRTYTPTADPFNPQPGEFVYNPYTQTTTLTLGDAYALLGGSVRVYSAPADTIPTDVVSGPFPAILEALPIEGTIEFSRNFEEHPSGSFTFRVRATNLEDIKEALRTGTEFDLYGIGMRINSLSVVEVPATQSPIREAIITANLGGKWENYLDDLPWDGEKIPRCGSTLQNASRFTSVQQLAYQSGAVLSAPLMRLVIPRDADSSDTVNWASEFESRVRIYGGFAFWSDGSAVSLKPLDGVRDWSFTEEEILSGVTTTIERDNRPAQAFSGNFNPPLIDLTAALPTEVLSPPVPTLLPESPIGLFVEYTGQKISNDLYSSEEEAVSAEAVQGQETYDQIPRWKRRETVSFTKVSGHNNPSSPPNTQGRHLSNNADLTGITKQQTVTTVVDGQTLAESVTTYGYRFLGQDTQPFWGIVEQRSTQHSYGVGGYYLGSTTTGFKFLRFKTEDPADPETKSLDPETDASELALYRFRQIPIYEAHRLVLRQFRDFYTAPSILDRLKLYRLCIGSSEVVQVQEDPNWVEPRFVSEELKISVAYDVTKNPDGGEDLITGQESRFYRQVVPYSGLNTVAPYYLSDVGITAEELEQRSEREYYAEFTSEWSSGDAQFQNSLEQSGVQYSLGRPPEGQRRSNAFREEKLPPEKDAPVPKKVSFEYYLTTPDYIGPSVGSISFPGANTLDRVLRAAKTDIVVQNFTQGSSETIEIAFNPEIAEGDRVQYIVNGIVRQRRVLQVNHTLTIDGLLDGQPIVKGRTSLQLGRDPGAIPVLVNSQPAPDEGNSNLSVTIGLPPYYAGSVLGNLDFNIGRNRGSF
jgi:hypothetical protein